MPIEPFLLARRVSRPLSDTALSLPSAGPRTSLLLRALLHDCQLSQLEKNASIDHYDDFEVVGSELGVDPPTVFCGACRDLLKITLELGSDSPFDLLQRQFGSYDLSPIPHHKNLFEFLDCCNSPRGSCHLCQILLFSCQRKISIRRATGQSQQLEARFSPLALTTTCEMPQLEARAQLSNKIENWSLSELGDSTESTETFNQIKHWIHDCTKDHAECQMEQGFPSELPTRLVEIEVANGSFRFRLTTTFPEGCQYTALSYRWGSDTSYSLRADTEAHMRNFVSTTELPKTLRDACIITSRLGLSYIWIDRLCIFQDSNNDWAYESSRMAQVYRNAFCTISAACASNEQSGCFRRRRTSSILPLDLQSCPFTGGKVRIMGNSILDEEGYEMMDHLTDRGWIFQERCLSRRILYFGRNQVYWECRLGVFGEACPSGGALFEFWKKPLAVYPEGDWNARAEAWANIVDVYSSKRLTYQSDRLPALSGMAYEMQHPLKDQYLAGLWRQTLLRDLCWVPDIPIGTPIAYQAPSWSWASHSSHVQFRAGLRKMGEIRGYLATVKQAHVETAGENPFGQVRNGWITLSGHLRLVQLERKFGVTLTATVDGAPLSPFLSFQPDNADSRLQDWKHTQAYCLPLFHDCLPSFEYHNFYMQVYCLLLVPHSLIEAPGTSSLSTSIHLGQGSVYERIALGAISLSKEKEKDVLDWILEAPLQEVTIV